MQPDEALALLRLPPDADLESAERVHHNLKTNIERRLAPLPQHSTYRDQLLSALAQFNCALDCLREWHASQSSSVEPVPENWLELDPAEASGEAQANAPEQPHTEPESLAPEEQVPQQEGL